ncbi:hypothetical protein ACQPZP_41415 [Spirillospora sp. CA-142024]|uniref:hypothetical protein n=1 Tax=Spirillospora sp. CA-142024 TaxID=3240036 RepID=UPI003D927E2C
MAVLNHGTVDCLARPEDDAPTLMRRRCGGAPGAGDLAKPVINAKPEDQADLYRQLGLTMSNRSHSVKVSPSRRWRAP